MTNVKRAAKALSIVALIAAAGWWLTLEPGEHESWAICQYTGVCDND